MKKKQTIKDLIYSKYRKETNMNGAELKKWNKNPLSKKASLNRKPIQMAIRLKGKKPKQWGLTEIKWALRKAIPYLRRAKKIKSKNKIGKNYTKNQIALKNWGFDVKKRRRK